MQALGIEVINSNGNWALDEHLVNGSSKSSINGNKRNVK
jgi:hypothetical protein